jgi:hypothetical protein
LIGRLEDFFDRLRGGFFSRRVLGRLVDRNRPQVDAQLLLNRRYAGRLAVLDRAVGASHQVRDANDKSFQLADAVTQGRDLVERTDQRVPLQRKRLVGHLENGLAKLIPLELAAPEMANQRLGQKLLRLAP